MSSEDTSAIKGGGGKDAGERTAVAGRDVDVRRADLARQDSTSTVDDISGGAADAGKEGRRPWSGRGAPFHDGARLAELDGSPVAVADMSGRLNLTFWMASSMISTTFRTLSIRLIAATEED